MLGENLDEVRYSWNGDGVSARLRCLLLVIKFQLRVLFREFKPPTCILSILVGNQQAIELPFLPKVHLKHVLSKVANIAGSHRLPREHRRINETKQDYLILQGQFGIAVPFSSFLLPLFMLVILAP